MNQDKPTLKFSLAVGAGYDSGFKLNVSASGKEEIEIAEGLTKLLIEKIEKITVNIGEGVEGGD